MARQSQTFKGLANVPSNIRSENARAFGGRTVLPGTYKFPAAEKAEFRVTTVTIPANGDRQEREFTTVEVLSDRGWIAMGSLAYRTLQGKSLVYINEFINSVSTDWELAESICGRTLTVEKNQIQVYSSYKNGELQDAPVPAGFAYHATLSDVVVKAAEPAEAAAAPAAETAESAAEVKEPAAADAKATEKKGRP